MRSRLETLVQRRGGVSAGPLNHQILRLGESATAELQLGLQHWQAMKGVERLWNGSESLWTDGDESQWLGWLTMVAELLEEDSPAVEGLGEAVEREILGLGAGEGGERPSAVVLLGMGGSSLGPEVLSLLLACRWPLFVLDTTDPTHIARIESQIDLKRTLFVVSSKSGSTLETSMLFDYFFDRVKLTGVDKPGAQFVAVTDEGSKLEHLARERGLRAVFFGKKSIGGRYSVLSNFGLVPSAALGIDTTRLLEAAVPMVQACTNLVGNPGLELGLVLGQAALAGRDKVTFLAPESLRAFGGWAEQLLAESTGKEGKGLIPVDLEAPMGVERYGQDRLFVSLELSDQGGSGANEGGESSEYLEVLEKRLGDLEQAGHPIVRISFADEYSVAQEFFRWQFATAVAGAVLKIHPFDQPDVEASKVESRRLTDAFEQNGSLPAEEPVIEGTRTVFFTDPWNRRELGLDVSDEDRGLVDVLQSHLARIGPGDYFAILAYLERNEENREMLQSMRGKVAQQLGVATCLGFGPRFLHSTGQAYKGGPNTGVFLQITHEETADLEVPGRSFTFGVAKNAQARGDFEVLAERRRRLLRVHFRGRLVAGLQRLDGLIGRSLQAVRDSD